MKFLVAAVAFVATIALTTQTLANEKEENISQKMNSLYPTKQANPAMAVRPKIVELKSPTFLSTVGAGSVKLEWTASNSSEQYHLQVASDPNFKWLVVNEKFVANTSFDFTKAETGKRYFWRVAGFKGDNNSMYTKSNFVSSAFNVK